MPLIELMAVRRHYQADGIVHVALQDVCLTVAAGEFVAVAGPSGAGKSTLLHLIGGLDRPSSGRVVIDGVDLATASEQTLDAHRRDRVGFVFQAFHLNPRRTARDNVMLPLVFGAPRSEADARETAGTCLRQVGLEDLAERRVATLSGGQRQRVALARALVRAPRILLADEPVGDLDAETGRGIIDLLSRINRERGVTIVAVTHDEALLAEATTRLRLVGGRLEAPVFGATAEDPTGGLP